VDAAENDIARVGIRGLQGEFEGIAAKIGEFYDLITLVVVAEGSLGMIVPDPEMEMRSPMSGVIFTYRWFLRSLSLYKAIFSYRGRLSN